MPVRTLRTTGNQSLSSPKRTAAWRYGVSLLLTACGVLLTFASYKYFGPGMPFLWLCPSVFAAAWYGGLGPGLLATSLATVAGYSFDFFDEDTQSVDHFLVLAFFAIGAAVSAWSAHHRRVEREREILAAIVESSHDAIIGKTLDGVITSWNAGAEEIYGYSAAEIVGKPISTLAPPDRASEITAALKGLKQGERFVRFETVRVRKDGTFIDVSLTISPMQDASGKVIGVSTIARDISARKQAERALKESEERLRQLAENIRQVFWVADVKARKVLYVSPAYEEVWGRSCQSLYEELMSFVEAVHPDDRERAREMIQHQLAGTETDEEFRIVRPNGSIRWIHDRAFPVRDSANGVSRVVGIAEDITEQKQVEQILRESEARFRTLADNAPVLIWMAGTDGLCTYFNMPWLEFTGRTLEQEMGNGWTQGVHPEDIEHCLTIYRSALAAQKSFQMEYRLRRADGEYRWVLNKGSPQLSPDGSFRGYVGACVDISERKWVEEALQGAFDESALQVKEEASNVKLVFELLRRVMDERKLVSSKPHRNN